MEFTYRLTGLGWSEARVADDVAWAALTASYLSDALGDLLEAVGAILEGANEARVSWQEEPGEYRWIFTRQGDSVHLRILSFFDQMPAYPDSAGKVVFETKQSVKDLGDAFATGAELVLTEIGEDGYLAKWFDAPFPTAHLTMIRDRLATL